jgi:geranylgeranyl diphosphate synthase type II
MDLKKYLQFHKQNIETALRALIPLSEHYPPQLHEAMHYSLFAGGKRIRPILHLATVEACKGDYHACMPFACAIELIHTYSLIHDDLPSMDDDELRRGRPTNHIVFGEAVALLAGDALLTEAFRLVSNGRSREALDPTALLMAIHELSSAAGSQGMIGGQTIDIESEGKEVEAETLQYIHVHKTGALIRASTRTGALLCDRPPEHVERFTRYGELLGLAFQVRDDLLNVEGDPERLGKSVGTDAARGKITYPGLFGIDASRKRLNQLVHEALEAIEPFDEQADPLREISQYMVARDH